MDTATLIGFKVPPDVANEIVGEISALERNGNDVSEVRYTQTLSVSLVEACWYGCNRRGPVGLVPCVEVVAYAGSAFRRTYGCGKVYIS
jgi:hypothetical protein